MAHNSPQCWDHINRFENSEYMRILKIETHQTLVCWSRHVILPKKNVFPYRLNSNRRRVFHFTKLLLKICTVSEIRRVELYFINNWRDQTTSTSQLEEMYNCLFVGILT